jgi:hypothetical protein
MNEDEVLANLRQRVFYHATRYSDSAEHIASEGLKTWHMMLISIAGCRGPVGVASGTASISPAIGGLHSGLAQYCCG